MPIFRRIKIQATVETPALLLPKRRSLASSTR